MKPQTFMYYDWFVLGYKLSSVYMNYNFLLYIWPIHDVYYQPQPFTNGLKN